MNPIVSLALIACAFVGLFLWATYPRDPFDRMSRRVQRLLRKSQRAQRRAAVDRLIHPHP